MAGGNDAGRAAAGSLSERIAGLSLEKRALLEQRLNEKKRQLDPDRILCRGRWDAPVPLSFAQERLWFLNRLEPGHSFYNLPLALKLSGPIDIAVLGESLNAIVLRHEALRSRFTILEERPMQIVRAAAEVELPIVDLHSLAEAERAAESRRLAAEEAASPFDLEHDLLIRAKILRLGAGEQTLLLTMHHIVADGWSIGILLRELSALYAAGREGKPSPLSRLAIQYADYALWQRALLQGPALDDLLSYWKRKLADVQPLMALATDRPRPPVQAFRGAAYTFPIARAVVEGLKSIGREVQGTLFMVLLAAFKVLLCRYSGHTDVMVGTPIANRPRRELEMLIGFFVNTLVLRTSLADDPTFRQLAGRVRDVTLEAFAHQNLPFEKLVEELHPARNLSHNPVVQAMFALQNTENGPQPGSAPDAPQHMAGTSKFDLTLAAVETTDGLTLGFEYNSTLFDAATIESMAASFRKLLIDASARPDSPVSELRLIEPGDRRRLISEARGRSDDRGSVRQVHELCDLQARLRPDEPAIVWGDGRVTYGELAARVRRLAHALRAHGAGPGSAVGICMQRSPEAILAVLATLKAGSAYVPIDPAAPEEWIREVLEHSGARLLLTQELILPRVSTFAGTRLCVDAGESWLARDPEDDPVPGSRLGDLACIVYPPRSTGRPAGVMIGHLGLCNLIEAQRDVFALPAASRVLQLAPLSSAAWLFEILISLGAGGTLHPVPGEERLRGGELARVVRDEKIDVLMTTPSVLAGVPWVSMPDLGTVIALGERAPAEILSRCSAGRRVFCAYGHPEASLCPALAEHRGSQLHALVGRPLRNTCTYILDEHLEPAPDGVPGELWIGDLGVAQGYYRQPDLTAERYRVDPFSDRPGARMVRTGDRVVRAADGEIRFLGLPDPRATLRGYRIDVRDIEAPLLRHPAIREAAVALRGTREGDACLVAYCSPAGETLPAALELRDFLGRYLPELMLPSRFIQLESLPLDRDGCLDREALPPLDAIDVAADRGAGAPSRTDTEKRLAAIWRDILTVPSVGVDDNFFELGGHSLLATRVMMRVIEEFETEISLRRFFEASTIAELAREIDAARTDSKRFRQATIARQTRTMVAVPAEPE